MQIVVHMSLVNISMPGNASVFFGYLLQIVAFDMVPTDDPYDAIFGFETSKPVSLNFELIGYESVYFIRNMGSMFLLILLTTFVVILYAATSCSKNVKVYKYRQMVKEKLFFNGIFAFLEDTYIIICVSFALNLAVLYDENAPANHAGTIFSLILAIASGATLIGLPIFVGIYFPRNIDYIYECDYEFKQKFGVVFKDLNVKRRGKVAFALPVC